MLNLGNIKRALPSGLLATAKSAHDRYVDWRMRASWWADLDRCAADITAASLRDVCSWGDWCARRPIVRQRFLWMLGLDPLPGRALIEPRTTGTLERKGYSVEKVVFESLPGLWVTANLYLPRDAARPAPCILYLCGHQIHPLGAKTQFQDRFLWYPEHGFACLAIDSLLCGEIQGCHRGTHTLGRWDWLSRGYTPAGVEVWNAMRAIDYLEGRPEVDAARIGVTGTSGGGVMTWMVAALDDRIRAAVPSASAYAIQSQVRRRLMPHQCDCTYYPNVYRMDFAEVGALAAPKPILLLAGRRDRIFPPAGYLEMHRKLEGLYRLHSEGDVARIQLAECNRGHAESFESICRAREWMVRWLSPDSNSPVDCRSRAPASERPEDLACLAEIPADLLNFSIHNRFVQTCVPKVPDSATEWTARRAFLMGQLSATVFNGFPPRQDAPFQLRRRRGSGGHARRFARFSEWQFSTETLARIRIHLFEPKAADADCPLLVVVKGNGEQMQFPDDEILPVLADHRVIVLAPRFAQWNPSPAEYAVAERAAAICGRSIAGLQTWDAIRAVRWALDDRELSPRKTSLFGRKEGGIVALYAALFEPRIDQVVLQNPPASHRLGPALPTVLRTTDIPEVAGALAPRELTFVGAPPAAFQLAREIFRLTGDERNYRIEESLVAALRGGHCAPNRPSRHPEE